MSEISTEAKIICFSNQKGGCGKTTMANEMAAGLTRKGMKVLAIDMDPQGDLSLGSGATTSQQLSTACPTMYEVLKKKVPARNAIQHCKNYDIIPANIYLANAEMEIAAEIGREVILRKALKPIRSEYDYIVIDTPPALGILTVNAFTAADEIIVPILPDLYAIGGMAKLNDIVQVVKENFNPTLKIAGIVFTQFDMRTNSSQTLNEITNNVAKALEVEPYSTKIRKAVAVEDARTNGMTIEEYGNSKGKKPNVQADFELFVDEYLEREEREKWL